MSRGKYFVFKLFGVVIFGFRNCFESSIYAEQGKALEDYYREQKKFSGLSISRCAWRNLAGLVGCITPDAYYCIKLAA
ncbi:hypothetical protein K2173_013890 [Erythroxylum novogranatense]|uniref:Uncharacterized protein n=1 Tax=Erythroxylum novogranatense TaxID=1862640 RepID=A0AAV8SD62_9ROSI|nr:hypothetical protein K2173_013890 [Erythroxylum novogranatense]